MAAAISVRRSLLDAMAGLPYPVRQAIFGIAYRMVPRRLGDLPPLLTVTLRDLPRCRNQGLLPDPRQSLDRPDGLCGLTGPINVGQLLEGYRRGAFVMSHIGPQKWWAPRHRMVLFFDQTRVEKSVRRLLHAAKLRVTFDQAFDRVVEGCATPRPGSLPITWITPKLKRLFSKAHVAGHAHSVEIWQDGELVGGLFGLAIGRAFATESQFHTVRDASKLAFAVLNRHLQGWGYAFNDCKHSSRHLAAAGCRLVSREEFTAMVERRSRESAHRGRWHVEDAWLDDTWKPARAGGHTYADELPGGSVIDRMTPEEIQAQRSTTW